MKEAIKKQIKKLDFQQLNLLLLHEELNKKYSLVDIQQALNEVKNDLIVNKSNEFGKCGIDPEVNPCGDADEY